MSICDRSFLYFSEKSKDTDTPKQPAQGKQKTVFTLFLFCFSICFEWACQDI